ncbi:response regulator [Candidatus Saccharibacteria bacterium]|nr:response regulator [Candidatus Saccharibacteria bacterium]
MIFVIDDDEIMAECIARWAKGEVKKFTNAIEAMNAISDGVLPDMIFLDILLDGPDGFTFLNEMVSYDDTAKIPVVVVSSLDLSKYNLAEYGVVKVLSKDTMVPADIKECVDEYAK